MATDEQGKYTVQVPIICILPSRPLGKVEGHITITDLQATVVHGVAAHWNCVFY